MFGFGTTEIILIVGVLVLFFGAKKISDLAYNIGEAIKHIRGGFSDEVTKDKSDRNS
jgi:sec-independent protein translocase protein TatA